MTVRGLETPWGFRQGLFAGLGNSPGTLGTGIDSYLAGGLPNNPQGRRGQLLTREGLQRRARPSTLKGPDSHLDCPTGQRADCARIPSPF